jgi:signal peptidase II
MNFLVSLKEFKKHLLKKENIFFFIFIIIIFFLDRFSKIIIIDRYINGIHYVNDFINLDLIWNIGIGFGFLSTASSLFYNLISLIIGTVILFLIFIFNKANKIDKITYSIIIGGALGNFYDRIVYKAVPDFIDIHYNNFHWFTFNLADVFITLGIFIFIIKSFLVKD